MTNYDLIIYTDGASRGNPGPGGFGAVIIDGSMARELAGGVSRATNNQMELAAVAAALSDEGVRGHAGTIVVHSDSAYVVNGLNSWVWGWEKKGWKTINKTPVENRDLWEELLACLKEYGNRLTIAKVSGHAGELYNERCDELAVAAALGEKQHLFHGTITDYQSFLDTMGTTAKKKAAPKKKKSDAPAYSYVSYVDGTVHVDKTWAACEKRVKGKKGAKYQKVFSKAEETDLLQDYTLQSLL